MKNISLALLLFALASCSSSSQEAKYKEEKNQAQFAESRAFTESPETLLRAAQAVLDEVTRESDPPASGAIRTDNDNVRTGWVYSISRDKYVEYKLNGSPKRRPLAVRRKYSYTVTPALSGSQAIFGVEEEIEEIDLETGKREGWKEASPDRQVYDWMLKKLRDQVRSQ